MEAVATRFPKVSQSEVVSPVGGGPRGAGGLTTVLSGYRGFYNRL